MANLLVHELILFSYFSLKATMEDEVFKARVAGKLNETSEVRASVEYEDYQVITRCTLHSSNTH